MVLFKSFADLPSLLVFIISGIIGAEPCRPDQRHPDPAVSTTLEWMITLVPINTTVLESAGSSASKFVELRAG